MVLPSRSLLRRSSRRRMNWGDNSMSSCRRCNRATGSGATAGAPPMALSLSGELSPIRIQRGAEGAEPPFPKSAALRMTCASPARPAGCSRTASRSSAGAPASKQALSSPQSGCITTHAVSHCATTRATHRELAGVLQPQELGVVLLELGVAAAEWVSTMRFKFSGSSLNSVHGKYIFQAERSRKLLTRQLC